MVVPATAGTTRIGWIGTGVMGHSMCGHLLSAGYPVTLFTRTPAKAEDLLAAGAQWADSPARVAQASDVVLAIVGMPSDVEQVFLGDAGVLAGAAPGTVVIDMTTSRPDLARRIAAAADARGIQALDAPVSGGDVGARQGTLSIMVGGAEATFEQVRPILEWLGKTIVHQGPAGSGQHAKMVNQILVAAGMMGVCEALLYARAAGLDLETVLSSVSQGAAGSWALSNLAPRIVSGDFAPGFFVDHFVKDLGIALEEARRLQLSLPGLELAERLYRQVQEQGRGERGTQALQLTLAELSGMSWQ